MMLGSLNVLNFFSKANKFVNKSDLLINSACIQCVRWKRKPMWLPTAKSKLFVIPVKPKVDESEERELKRLHDRYKTYMHAIRNYFHEEYIKTSRTSVAAIQGIKGEQEEHARCIKENDEWNRHVALIREERLKKEKEIKREQILKTIDAAEERRKQRLEQIDQLVREEKERAKFYITAENIDKAIDEALATTVDHNYAIDVGGNIYRGRRTKPSDVPSDELEKIQVPASS